MPARLNQKAIREIKKIYRKIRTGIKKRLEEFKKTWQEGNEEDIFKELVFCIFTPQSKAKVCWSCVKELCDKDFLFKAGKAEISEVIKRVRFRHHKASYLVLARDLFTSGGKLSIKPRIRAFSDVFKLREWLVKNIKGIGYKEASHFLRNIGMGKNLAILDRHILKNLKNIGIITEIPQALSKNTYLEIENKMRNFSHYVNIPFNHLDLLFWYKQTGEIFK